MHLSTNNMGLTRLQPVVKKHVDALIEAVRTTSFNDSLGGVTLFGSWVHVGPQHPDSDMDLIFVTNPGMKVDLRFDRQVQQVIATCQNHNPWPVSAVSYGFEDIREQLGPLNTTIYSMNSISLMGLDLPFKQWASEYSTLEVRRSAMCAFTVTWQIIRSSIVEAEQIIPNDRKTLLACLRGMRQAFWVLDNNERFPGNHFNVVPMLYNLVKSLPDSQLIADLWMYICNPQLTIPAGFTERVLTFMYTLADHTREHFGIISRGEKYWYMRW